MKESRFNEEQMVRILRESDLRERLRRRRRTRSASRRYNHDEAQIKRFLKEKSAAWMREGLPFHLWLTSPACEILDVTFAMNLGWAESREECEQLLVYQSSSRSSTDHVYHPMLIGPAFFHQIGAVC